MSDPIEPAMRPSPPLPSLSAPAAAAAYAPHPPPSPGYAAPYSAPRPPAAGIRPPETAPSGAGLGLAALVLAVLGTLGASVVGAASAWQLGLAAGRGSATAPIDADFDWSVLAPVRDWALAGEVSLWAGTALGIAAIVSGIIALITRRGRVPGTIAVVVAALGPVVFFAAVAATLSLGLTAGSGIGG
ncbi:hypothetical protein [Microbacterium sp. RU33B]|uniref:hypothetical protein n=1 Tax=Microbacterium sp. RU33B TaxID=1907390 RepID=UPI00096029A5|nr:hypothetical protein [Microbacterium sp. RU33B]SIT71102.1 hypothetical protein SAMN05880545_0803 [Microbacterium sp. RU33B]